METRELTKEAQDLGIVQTTGELTKLGMLCAIEATNKIVLIERINQIIGMAFFEKNPDADYLHVGLGGEQLGCSGGSANYKTEADVPEHSVPCPCGNPKHWLIKYERGRK